jgi:hypothetical protein
VAGCSDLRNGQSSSPPLVSLSDGTNNASQASPKPNARFQSSEYPKPAACVKSKRWRRSAVRPNRFICEARRHRRRGADVAGRRIHEAWVTLSPLGGTSLLELQSKATTGVIAARTSDQTISQIVGTANGASHQSGAVDAVAPTRGLGLALALRTIQTGPLIVLLLIWGMFAFLSPFFFTQGNLANILIQSSSVALLALGALVVVMVGSLDLSLGASAGFCTIVAAVLFRDYASLGWLIIPIVLITGAAVGAVNSLVIVMMRFGNAFIVTLGTLYMVQSLSYVLSGGSQVPGVPDALLVLANENLLGLPGPIVLVLVSGALLGLFLNRAFGVAGS